MKRPLMGLGIALVAGVAAGMSGIFWLWIFLSAAGSILLIRLWTDSSCKYLLGLSVFFIVGFCRSIMCFTAAPSLDGSLQGEIYKIQEKEKSIFIYMKGEDRSSVLTVVKKEGETEPSFYKGQIYKVSGEAENFTMPSNPGQFDEISYYQSQGIDYRIWAESVELVNEGDWFHRRLRCLEILKARMEMFYSEYMTSEGAGILRAAVLGDRSGFQEELRQYYQDNGWMHLVTTSGLHLSFIAMGVYRRMRRCTIPPGMSTMFAFILMMAYGYLSDYGDSMLRAMGMMILMLIGQLLGRKTDVWTSLTLLGSIMLIQRPARLMSSGFLLTYGAVIGMELGKWVRKGRPIVRNKSRKEKFMESLCMQTGIFVVTLPILLWYMYEIPLLGFFYNFFMIPLIALIVPLAFAAGILGALNIPAVVWIAKVILKIIDVILNVVHRLPSRALICGRPAAWQMAVFIGCLGVAVLLIKGSRKKLGMAVIGLGCIGLIFLRMRVNQMVFLDVGQGDGICVLTQEGQAVFVDGGSSDVRSLYTYRIQPFLKYYGIDQIDVWILTHGDSDHVSGIQEALEKDVSVGRLLLPAVGEDPTLDEIRKSALKRDIDVQIMYPGNRLMMGEYIFTCLSPDQGRSLGDRNNNSMVLKVEWKEKNCNVSILLTGDIEEAGEKRLLEEAKLTDVDILKVAHHGSSGGTTRTFLDEVRPEWGIISCGEDNRYGHPHQETLERLVDCGCQWVTTSGQGAVFIECKRDGYQIYGYQKKD